MKVRFKENTTAVIKKKFVKKNTFRFTLVLTVLNLFVSGWCLYTLYKFNQLDLLMKAFHF